MRSSYDLDMVKSIQRCWVIICLCSTVPLMKLMWLRLEFSIEKLCLA